jgi:hypothetical protein
MISARTKAALAAAKRLEQRGIPAARGGKWSAVQVGRLLEAAAIPFSASPASASLANVEVASAAA